MPLKFTLRNLADRHEHAQYRPSSYWKAVARGVVSISDAVTYAAAKNQWRLEDMYFTTDPDARCSVHTSNRIKYVFVVKHIGSGEEKELGSDCVASAFMADESQTLNAELLAILEELKQKESALDELKGHPERHRVQLQLFESERTAKIERIKELEAQIQKLNQDAMHATTHDTLEHNRAKNAVYFIEKGDQLLEQLDRLWLLRGLVYHDDPLRRSAVLTSKLMKTTHAALNSLRGLRKGYVYFKDIDESVIEKLDAVLCSKVPFLSRSFYAGTQIPDLDPALDAADAKIFAFVNFGQRLRGLYNHRLRSNSSGEALFRPAQVKLIERMHTLWEQGVPLSQAEYDKNELTENAVTLMRLYEHLKSSGNLLTKAQLRARHPELEAHVRELLKKKPHLDKDERKLLAAFMRSFHEGLLLDPAGAERLTRTRKPKTQLNERQTTTIQKLINTNFAKGQNPPAERLIKKLGNAWQHDGLFDDEDLQQLEATWQALQKALETGNLGLAEWEKHFPGIQRFALAFGTHTFPAPAGRRTGTGPRAPRFLESLSEDLRQKLGRNFTQRNFQGRKLTLTRAQIDILLECRQHLSNTYVTQPEDSADAKLLWPFKRLDQFLRVAESTYDRNLDEHMRAEKISIPSQKLLRSLGFASQAALDFASRYVYMRGEDVQKDAAYEQTVSACRVCLQSPAADQGKKPIPTLPPTVKRQIEKMVAQWDEGFYWIANKAVELPTDSGPEYLVSVWIAAMLENPMENTPAGIAYLDGFFGTASPIKKSDARVAVAEREGLKILAQLKDSTLPEFKKRPLLAILSKLLPWMRDHSQGGVMDARAVAEKLGWELAHTHQWDVILAAMNAVWPEFPKNPQQSLPLGVGGAETVLGVDGTQTPHRGVSTDAEYHAMVHVLIGAMPGLRAFAGKNTDQDRWRWRHQLDVERFNDALIIPVLKNTRVPLAVRLEVLGILQYEIDRNNAEFYSPFLRKIAEQINAVLTAVDEATRRTYEEHLEQLRNPAPHVPNRAPATERPVSSNAELDSLIAGLKAIWHSRALSANQQRHAVILEEFIRQYYPRQKDADFPAKLFDKAKTLLKYVYRLSPDEIRFVEGDPGKNTVIITGKAVLCIRARLNPINKQEP